MASSGRGGDDNAVEIAGTRLRRIEKGRIDADDPSGGGCRRRVPASDQRVMRVRRLALVPLVLVLAMPAASDGADPGVNGRLLISRGPSHDQSLLTLDPSTHRPRWLIPYGEDIYATYSPDGTKIALMSNVTGNSQIYTMNADGSGLRRLTHDSWADGAPTWSPDGKKIAFASNRDGDFDIWVMNANGTDPVNLTNQDPGADDGPQWSPDGRWIAYNSNDHGYWTVWFVHPDGTYLAGLAPTPTSTWFDNWSPDGHSFLVEGHESGNLDIYRYDLPNTDPIQWNLLVPKQLTNNPSADFGATWSPDGKQIAFSSNRDGNLEIYTMNSNGGTETRITHNKTDDYVDDWQPLHDLQAPTAHAVRASGRSGGRATFAYRAYDNSGRASVEIDVSLGKQTIWETYTKLLPRQPNQTYATKWHAYPTLRGRTLKFCVTAFDPSANESIPSCKAFRLG